MESLQEAVRETRRICLPPPSLTVSEWADRYRRLSSESSPEPFAWRTSRAEYQRGMMDAFSDARNRRVVVMSSAQIGKTSIVENIVGYFIHLDPSPILVVEPTLDMSEALSKDRLAPMFRDTPVLAGKVADARSRDSGNTLLHKRFPGGHVTMAGANSTANLSSRPIRVVLCDEVDRFPPKTTEGNPVKLAIKRTNNFWNRRIGLFSTPTFEDVGIHAEWKQSDQRRFFVPCRDCGHHQLLEWERVSWTKDDASDASYTCSDCGALWNETARNLAVSRGVWQATAPFRGVAGFHVNELYSPWRSFADVALDYLESEGDPEKYRVWENTSLGLPHKEEGSGVSIDALKDEDGFAVGVIPAGALYLTLGVDTQGNRLALQLVGWGRSERGQLEQWTIDYVELPGDPDLPDTWDRLTEYRRQKWDHPLGGELGVSITAIDSGGRHSHQVVAYARKYRTEGVIAIKGSSTPLPVMLKTKPTKVDFRANGKVHKKGGEVWFVGTDTTKSSINGKLKTDGEHRVIHFATGLQEDYFRQLTAETYDKHKKRWTNPKRKRNEALDTLVYATAATVHPWLRLDIAPARKWLKRAESLTVDRDESPQQQERPPEKPKPAPTVKRPARRIGTFGSFGR